MERSEQINLRLRPGEKARLGELANGRTLTDYLLRDVRGGDADDGVPETSDVTTGACKEAERPDQPSEFDIRVHQLATTMPRSNARKVAFQEGLRP